MIRRATFIVPLITLLVAGCVNLPEAEDPVLVQGLPTMKELADSLQNERSAALKWVVQSGKVDHVFQSDVDWSREFTAFLQDDVNHLRYKDAYSVSDTIDDGLRTVTFLALSDGQEVRKMKYVIRSGRLVGFELVKDRSNFLSSSSQTFRFDESEYSLSIKQNIDWFFENNQFIHGSIVPRGELWRAVFDLGGDPLPVQCILQDSVLIVKNGSELLRFPKTGLRGDSTVFSSSFFNAYFLLLPTDENNMVGRWVNEKRDTKKTTPVRFSRGAPYRFRVSASTPHDIGGEHLMLFADRDGVFNDSAVLIIHQTEHAISGSIMTETGDYRFLEGVVRSDSMFLSTMDGTHAYLFQGAIQGDSILGVFCVGQSTKHPWVAKLGTTHSLPSAETITKVSSGRFDFSFPDQDGNIVALSDDRFRDKVTLVTVMGTWCSNCLDETLFLKKVRDRYAEADLQIVALDFELVSDSAVAQNNIQRHVKNLGVPYPVLLASLATTKEKASSLLPSLNGVFSYPTLIVLDRDHKVVKVHTGFNGPATGRDRYMDFERTYFSLFDSLVAE